MLPVALQVDVLELKPRPNPGKGGRAYGWTGSAWWGYPWAVGFKTGQPREVITVLEVGAACCSAFPFSMPLLRSMGPKGRHWRAAAEQLPRHECLFR